MPSEVLNGIWRKTKEKIRHVDMRISWPDEGTWKEDPLSEVFIVETRDADFARAPWQELGHFATKSTAQKRADDYLGASHTEEWQSGA